MKKREKTNAIRLVEAAGVAYEAIDYPVDENHLEATHVAQELNEDPAVVYKTIVLRGQKSGPVVCVVAADREIDLKKAAKAFGDKKMETLPLKELQPLTGYIRGGCTAIGMKKKLPVAVSAEFPEHEHIYVSAGRRGTQLKLTPADYMKLTDAFAADITA